MPMIIQAKYDMALLLLQANDRMNEYAEGTVAMSNVGIDRKQPQKLYCQLVDILKEPIAKGVWTVGSQIPTEEQLSAQYGVSKATVRMAIEELVALGFLKKLQGKGTFVRRSLTERSIRMATDLAVNGAEYGEKELHRVLENKILRPGPEIARYLHLTEKDFCWHLSQLRILGKNPLTLERLYLPYSLCTQVIQENEKIGSFPQFIEDRWSVRIQRMKEKTDFLSIGEPEARLLQMAPQTHILRTQQIFFQNGDQPVGCRELLQPADGWCRTVEFERL